MLNFETSQIVCLSPASYYAFLIDYKQGPWLADWVDKHNLAFVSVEHIKRRTTDLTF